MEFPIESKHTFPIVCKIFHKTKKTKRRKKIYIIQLSYAKFYVKQIAMLNQLVILCNVIVEANLQANWKMLLFLI